MTYQLNAGDIHYAEPTCVVDRLGVPLTGLLTLVVAIRRADVPTPTYWDFGGVTPQLRTSGWTTRLASLTEISASLCPGYYQHAAGWDTTGLPAGKYVFEFADTGPTSGNMPQTDDAQIIAGTGVAAIKAVVDDLAITLAAIQGVSWSSATDTLQAIRAAIDAAQTDLDAIKGPGFGAGTDDLHSQTARAQTNLDAIDSKVTSIQSALGVLNSFSTIGTPTPTVIATDCTDPDDTWTGAILVSSDPDIPQHTKGVRVRSFVGGVFTVDALPWSISSGDTIVIRADIAPAVAGDQMALTQGAETAVAAASSSAVTTAHGSGSYLTATGFAVPGSAMTLTAGERATLSGVIGSDIITDHGAGSYVTADISSLATSTALATVQSAIDGVVTGIDALAGASFDTTADSLRAIRVLVSTLPTTAAPDAATIAAAVAPAVWSTALPGSFTTGQAGALLAIAGALAPPDVSAIADAVWDEAEGTPASGTYGYGIQFLRMLVTNRIEEAAGNPGSITLYADDGTTVFKTWTLRDGSGGPVLPGPTGEPARRGAAT